MDDKGAISPLQFVVQRQLDGSEIRRELFAQRLRAARNLYKKDLFAHYGCVNAIEFSSEGELLVSGGDDRRVLLWSVAQSIYGKCKATPEPMLTNHDSNIFCLSFDSQNTRVYSGGNDDQVLVHAIPTKQLVVKLPHKKPIYGLSVNPSNDCVLATAGDDGRILIYDIRDPAEAQCLARHKVGFHSVMYNPQNPALLIAANSEDGILLFDARKPKDFLIHYDKEAGRISGISACFNSTGDRVLALRRRLPPVLYATNQLNAIAQFYHPQYYNSCTMKTCCFAGNDDEYVLSGSDDFNLYAWRVPSDGSSEWGESHFVLRGHRSIVNQVRYNKQNNLIASSGVEKMIKLWSTLHVGAWSGSLTKDAHDAQRIVYSHDDYMNLVGPTGQRISHDYSDHSTAEDARMMAFFDSLIQREIEGWESQSEATFTSDSDSDTHVQDKIQLSWQSLSRFRVQADEFSKKYKPNRITQLIAHKRNRLAKMALWKSSTLVQRNFNREKHKKRKSSKKAKSKWVFRKASKRERAASPTTTNNSEKENQTRAHGSGNAHGSTSHSKHADRSSRPKKYNRHHHRGTRADCDHHNQPIDVPSTSTGITAGSSNNPIFRLVEQDSDEDTPQPASAATLHCDTRVMPAENLINILPTPLNGSQDMFINVLEIANTNVVVAPSVTSAYENYSSLSDSDYEMMVTPVKTRRGVAHHQERVEIDSGFATGPCTSSDGKTGRGRRHHQCADSSDEEYKYDTFRKRVKKARLNIRKQVGIDSDSN